MAFVIPIVFFSLETGEQLAAALTCLEAPDHPTDRVQSRPLVTGFRWWLPGTVSQRHPLHSSQLSLDHSLTHFDTLCKSFRCHWNNDKSAAAASSTSLIDQGSHLSQQMATAELHRRRTDRVAFARRSTEMPGVVEFRWRHNLLPR